MTYGELKTQIDASGATDATEIRSIHFERHSQADSVDVGYDEENDAIRIVQKS